MKSHPLRSWLAGVLLAVMAAYVAAQSTEGVLLVKRPAELRDSPGDAGRSLAPLALQTPLTRLPARQGAWIQVRTANGITGWVHMFDVTTSATASTGSNVATGALRGISNFFNRGSAQTSNTTATSTIGIRGLGAEDIASAQPNLTALARVDALRQDAAQARRFSAESSLMPQTVEPLPSPQAAAPNRATSDPYKVP